MAAHRSTSHAAVPQPTPSTPGFAITCLNGAAELPRLRADPASEALLKRHGVEVSRETLRKWMVTTGLWLARFVYCGHHNGGQVNDTTAV